MTTDNLYKDGPLDVKIDIDTLSEKKQKNRRKFYQDWVNRQGKMITKAGLQLNFTFNDLARPTLTRASVIPEWLKDGQVSGTLVLSCSVENTHTNFNVAEISLDVSR